MKGPKFSRRRFLGGVSVAAVAGAGYAHFFEAERLQISRVTAPISRGQRTPLKLLHISDLHASAVVSLEYIGRAIEMGLALAPDVICVTGDFITAQHDEPVRYASVLRRLSDAAPCFTVFGNHDGGEWAVHEGGYADLRWTTDLLRESRLPVLHNRSEIITINDRRLCFVGVGDLWAGDIAALPAFANASGEEVILLAHNPDSKDILAGQRWDLMLSGHTHGGQLSLPLIGTPLAPVRDKRFVAGLHAWNNRWLHITRGIGSIWGVRIHCPPEISLLTLS